MKHLFILVFCLTSLYGSSRLEECLQRCWSVDPRTASYISKKCEKLDKSVIEDFIRISEAQKIDFTAEKKLTALPKDDGIYQSPEEHLVLFENPFVRIFYGSTAPQKREPFHLHQWKSVMLVLQSTTYEMEYKDGSKEIGNWPMGAYELPAGEYYACTNIGAHADECLRFEIKN